MSKSLNDAASHCVFSPDSHRFSENTFHRTVKGLTAIKKMPVIEMRKIRFSHLLSLNEKKN
jgi:hypothetical protein